MTYVIGIDLGTTFSAVAYINKTGKPEIINNSEDKPITPSVIYFGEKEIIIGDEAKEMQALGENNVASFFKRSMGDLNFILSFHNKNYNPIDLSALILKKLKTDAEASLGVPISEAVITVPAYFSNFQRESTIKAGEIAGLKVLRIINEPTAAALAYGIKSTDKKQTLVVYDLGGGTFDISIVENSETLSEVKATAGDHELGGKDWDDRIAIYASQRFLEEFNKDPLEDSVSFNDLLVRCENAKKQLSTRESTKISITHGGEKGTYELTRKTFEEITRDLMERTQLLTEQTLKDINLTWKDIDGVLLVGGSTRMPMVWKYIEEISGKKPMQGVNVDESVALGAAIQANLDSQQNKNPLFTLAGKKTTKDVISHSLGMVAINENRSKYINSILIPKNIPIPCSEVRPYQLRTMRGNKNQLEVYMLQGESDKPLECNILGKYVFSDIEHVPNKLSVMDIKYEYDLNGVVKVSATQKENNKNLPLNIESVPSDLRWLDLPPEDNTLTTYMHMSVFIAVDLSGSMSGEPLKRAQEAAKNKFIEKIDLTHTSVGLIGFADSIKVNQELCQNSKKLVKGVDVWTEWMTLGSVGWGNSAEPFSTCYKLMKDLEDPRFLIVLTDGVWSDQSKAIREAKKCHAEGIEVIAMGFGSADLTFLKAVSSSDENAILTDLSSLSTAFSKIAQVLTETGGGIQTMEDGAKQKKKGLLGFFG